jgi:hypothetical protein
MQAKMNWWNLEINTDERWEMIIYDFETVGQGGTT